MSIEHIIERPANSWVRLLKGIINNLRKSEKIIQKSENWTLGKHESSELIRDVNIPIYQYCFKKSVRIENPTTVIVHIQYRQFTF